MRTINPETRETVTVNVIDGALAVTIVGGGGGGSVAVDDITDAGTVGKLVMKAEDAATARTAIGAMASTYAPTWTQVTGKPSTFAPVPATATVTGGVKQGVAVSNAATTTFDPVAPIASDADLATAVAAINAIIVELNDIASNAGNAASQVNALLASLRTATVIAT